MQVNGSMEVSQELGAVEHFKCFGHICDGWMFSFAGTMSVVCAAASASLLFIQAFQLSDTGLALVCSNIFRG